MNVLGQYLGENLEKYLKIILLFSEKKNLTALQSNSANISKENLRKLMKGFLEKSVKNMKESLKKCLQKSQIKVFVEFMKKSLNIF